MSELQSRPATTESMAVESVALYGGGDRLYTVRDPLEAVGVDVEQNPRRPADVDATIVFSPGRTLFERLVEGADGPLVYRLSGDYWRVLRDAPLGRTRGWLADRLFARVDGCLTPDPRLDAVWRERTGTTATTTVGVPIDAEAWPTRTHDPGPLRCLTLGNFDYRAKAEPAIDWLPYVNHALDELGGRWAIAGDGRHADRLAAAAEPYPHVEFVGYVDALNWLTETDVLLHPSEADIAYPNAILEALASRIPVVAGPSTPFESNAHVCVGRRRALRTLLALLSDPARRAQLGEQGRGYVATAHAPDAIGTQIVEFLTALVRLEHFQ